jgi:hypothetical protein
LTFFTVTHNSKFCTLKPALTFKKLGTLLTKHIYSCILNKHKQATREDGRFLQPRGWFNHMKYSSNYMVTVKVKVTLYRPPRA